MSKNHNVQLVHEDTRITSAWGKLMRIVSDAFADDTVNTPSDLTPALVPDGTMKYVENLKCTFIYDQTSTLTPDAITIIDSDFGGNWLRQDPAQEAWSNQVTWHIDPINGSDLANGLALGTAIKTWKELQRRTLMETGEWIISVPVTVTIHSDFASGDVIDGTVHILETGSLNVVGERTVVNTHTTTAWATFTSSEPYKVTADWPSIAAYIGCLMEFTSGPATGYTCFIGKDAGGSAAWTSNPGKYNNDTSFVQATGATLPTLAGGDSFTVYDLPIIQIRRLHVYATRATAFTSNVGLCAFRYVDVRSDGHYYAYIKEDGGYNYGDLNFVQCILRSTHSHGARFNGCYMTGRFITHRNSSLSQFYCCMMTNMVIFSVWTNLCQFQYTCIFINCPVLIGGYCVQGSLAGDNIGIFDVPGSAFYAPLEIQNLGIARLSGLLFGVNPGVTYGVRMRFGGRLAVGGPWPTNLPTIAGSGVNQINFDGRARSWLQMPYLQSRWGTLITDAYNDSLAPVGNPDVMQTAGAITNTGAAMFLLPNGTEQANAVPGTTVPSLGYVVANNGTLQKLRVRLNVAPGIDVPIKVWRVPVGSVTPVATAVILTIPAASYEAVTTTLIDVVAPGDLLVIEHTNPGGSSATYLSASVEIA